MTFDRESLDRLFRYCLALTGQREEAQDLLHNALESYLTKRPTDVQDPAAYIRRIARNRFFDGLRRAGIVRFEALDHPELHAASERDLENMVTDELTVREVWQKLNPAEREIVFLWAVEGLSASEIALQLGQPRGSVLSRLHRMRIRISGDFPQHARGGRHE